MVIYDRNDIGLFYKNRDDRNSFIYRPKVRLCLRLNRSVSDRHNDDHSSFIIQAKGKALFKA